MASRRSSSSSNSSQSDSELPNVFKQAMRCVMMAFRCNFDIENNPKTGRDEREYRIETARKTGVLALTQIHLNAIPEEVFDISILRSLDLSGNALTDIPPVMFTLFNLRALHIKNNRIDNLPQQGWLAFGKMTVLRLDGNDLRDLPRLPPSLTTLTLAHNKLRSLPPTLLSLTKLKRLDMSNNAIRKIGSYVGKMQHLEELLLDHNKIRSVPGELADMRRLKLLSLQYNQIQARHTIQSPSPFSSLAPSPTSSFTAAATATATGAGADTATATDGAAPDTPEKGGRMSTTTSSSSRSSSSSSLSSSIRSRSSSSSSSSSRSNSSRSSMIDVNAQCISAEVLQRSSVEKLRLRGNPISMAEFLELEGVAPFLQRHKMLVNKQVSGGLQTQQTTGMVGLE